MLFQDLDVVEKYDGIWACSSILHLSLDELILKQAAASFRNVGQSEDYGFFDWKHKYTDKSLIFASVATLGDSLENICLGLLL